MNVYITYDRYEHNEWFSIYHIDTNKQRAIKHCKEIDLLDFISYGPDDCHSFQLQKVFMTKAEYKRFCELVENKGYSEHGELHDIMVDIFEQISCWNYDNILISSDGCSDAYEILKYYCIKKGIEADDDDAIDEAEEELCLNDELRKVITREYINTVYK